MNAYRRFLGLVVCSGCLQLLFPTGTLGQQPVVPISRLGVDLVKSEGNSFYGLVVSRDKKQVTIAVDRNWLKAAFPALMPTFRSQEEDRLEIVVDQYVQRIDKWIDERKDETTLVDLLKDEKRRIVGENTAPLIEQKKFILLQFDAKKVDRVFVQPDKRRKIAAIAWQYGVSDVTTRAVKELENELAAKQVVLDDEVVNLAGDLTAFELSDREWCIRKAVFEFSVLAEMEFQGTGSMLVEKTAKPDLNALIGTMMQDARSNQLSQLGRELGIPEFQTQATVADDAWQKKVTDSADQKGYRSVMVKRILPATIPDEVCVEASFLAKVDATNWERVVQVEGKAKLSEQNRDDLDQVQIDPQVQEIMRTLGGMGAGNNSSLIDVALRKGAATQAALQSANNKMADILGQNSLYLEWPLILK